MIMLNFDSAGSLFLRNCSPRKNFILVLLHPFRGQTDMDMNKKCFSYSL